MHIKTVLLDIEGTTTPISFVYDVLFPYARRHMEQFLCEYRDDPEIQSAIRSLQSENLTQAPGTAPPIADFSEPALLQSTARYCIWLMSFDRKSTPLKTIQGRIWKQGFLNGDLRGELFPDVPCAFKRWRMEKRAIAIYSSGSVLAQKLLFGHSQFGDLATDISFFFDTQTGPKRAGDSYMRIQKHIQCGAEEILFVSDALEEILAARQAGLHTALSVRPGNQPVDSSDVPCQMIRSFDELLLEQA